MTPSEVLKRLHASLFWDGHGYWLPDLCVKEAANSQHCPEPTFNEFLKVLAQSLPPPPAMPKEK